MAKKLLSGILVCAMLLCAATASFADSVPGFDVDAGDDSGDTGGDGTGLALKAESHLKLDRETGYVDGIDGIPTVAELAKNFEGPITVKSASGESKADDKLVACDDVISSGNDSLKALIYGDVNRDGKVSIGDAIDVLKIIAGWDTTVNKDAADVEKDGKVNVSDAIKLLKYVANWSGISLGNVRMVPDYSKQIAPAEDRDIEISFAMMMKSIDRAQTKNIGDPAFKMSLARNEYESCQAILVSSAAKEGLSAELSDFEYEYGGATLKGQLNWAVYYDYYKFYDLKSANVDNHGGDAFPEAMLKMASSFELTANKSQCIQVTAKSEKDSPAGMYRATLNIKNAAGEVVKTAYVYAYVWDFTLPDTPYSASLIGLSAYTLYSTTKKYHDDTMYQEYYEFLLEHNLSAYLLPDMLNTELGEQYMSDPRVTAFVIAGMSDKYGAMMSRDDEYIAEVYPKVAANPEWKKKGLFYMTDEPWGANLEDVKNGYERIKRVTGTDDFRNMTPFGFSWYGERQNLIDSFEYMKPYINVWCPISSAYTDWEKGNLLTRKMLNYGMGSYQWGDGYANQKLGPFVDRMNEMRERGDEAWWYICIGPWYPMPNIFASYDGAPIHDVMWQQFLYDIDGFLYYSTQNHWDTVNRYRFDIGDGDGTLLYAGEMLGSEGPVASWRLVQLRDAFDEFDYMRMAEELCGRDAVLEVVYKVTTGMTEFTEDPMVIDACRTELAQMIIDAQANMS